jgi:hypothetical protein
MLRYHRYRLSYSGTSALVKRVLPTGNGFGGSSLNIALGQKLVYSVTNSSILSTAKASPTSQQSSPLVFEFGKIVLLAVWFWCLIGADFCANSINVISCSYSQDL